MAEARGKGGVCGVTLVRRSVSRQIALPPGRYTNDFRGGEERYLNRVSASRVLRGVLSRVRSMWRVDAASVEMRICLHGQALTVPLPYGYQYRNCRDISTGLILDLFNRAADFAITDRWTEDNFQSLVLSGAIYNGAIAVADGRGRPVAFGALWSDVVPGYARIMYVLVDVGLTLGDLSRQLTRPN